jgi:hypothetical protein
LVEDGCTREPELVDILALLGDLIHVQPSNHVMLGSNREITFGEDNKLVPRNVELEKNELLISWGGQASETHLLDKLCDDSFRLAIRVGVGGVYGVDSTVPSGFEYLQGLLFIQNP